MTQVLLALEVLQAPPAPLDLKVSTAAQEIQDQPVLTALPVPEAPPALLAQLGLMV